MLAAIPLLGEWPKPMDYVGIAAITVGVFCPPARFRRFGKEGKTQSLMRCLDGS